MSYFFGEGLLLGLGTQSLKLGHEVYNWLRTSSVLAEKVLLKVLENSTAWRHNSHLFGGKTFDWFSVLNIRFQITLGWYSVDWAVLSPESQFARGFLALTVSRFVRTESRFARTVACSSVVNGLINKKSKNILSNLI